MALDARSPATVPAIAPAAFPAQCGSSSGHTRMHRHVAYLPFAPGIGIFLRHFLQDITCDLHPKLTQRLLECQLLPHLVLVEDFPDAAIRSRRIAAQTRRAVMSSFLIGTNIDRSLRNGGARSTRCLTAGRTESESSGLSPSASPLIGLSKAPDMPRLIPVVEDEYSALFRISLNPSVSVESRFWTHLRRSRSLLRPAACLPT